MGCPEELGDVMIFFALVLLWQRYGLQQTTDVINKIWCSCVDRSSLRDAICFSPGQKLKWPVLTKHNFSCLGVREENRAHQAVDKSVGIRNMFLES